MRARDGGVLEFSPRSAFSGGAARRAGDDGSATDVFCAGRDWNCATAEEALCGVCGHVGDRPGDRSSLYGAAGALLRRPIAERTQLHLERLRRGTGERAAWAPVWVAAARNHRGDDDLSGAVDKPGIELLVDCSGARGHGVDVRRGLSQIREGESRRGCVLRTLSAGDLLL